MRGLNMSNNFYQNFYKLEMAMQDNNEHVLIYGGEASGKTDAIECCLELLSKDNSIAVLTNRSSITRVAYPLSNVTCYNWNKELRLIDPSWITEHYDIIIIDGMCVNWLELMGEFKDSRIIMCIRANDADEIPQDLKNAFGIKAYTKILKKDEHLKGIASVKKHLVRSQKDVG